MTRPQANTPLQEPSQAGRSRLDGTKPGFIRPVSKPAGESFLNPVAILHAFRRRWKPALFLAIPLAVIAAGGVWLLIPAKYTAFSLLRIAAIEPRLVFDTAENKADFNTYRQTQTALITSRFVLNAAMRKPGVANSLTLSQQPFPLTWLESQLEIGTQRSPEILRIALIGDHPEELATIVNAVKDAYLEEVVHAERRDRLSRLSDLERIFQETDEKARHKQNRVEKLAKQLGTGDSRALTLKQQMALEYFSQLQREYSRVRFELMREQIEAGSQRKDFVSSTENSDHANLLPSPVDAGDAELTLLQRRAVQLRELISRFEKQVVDKNHPALTEHRRQLQSLEKQLKFAETDGIAVSGVPKRERTAVVSRREVLQRQEKLLKEEVEKYASLVDTIGTSTFELEAMQTELSQVTKISDRIGQEIEALRIELQSPPRVVPLQSAEVPQFRDQGKKFKLTGMAGVGSFAGVLGLFLLYDLLQRRVSGAEELKRETGLAVLGMLPGTNPLTKVRRPLTVSAADQAADSLRVRIGQSLPSSASHRILLLSSAAPEDAGTAASCVLGLSYAASERKTLIVDLDLRRPDLHRQFGMSNDIGLSDVLRRDIDWRTAIVVLANSTLAVLPAGACSEDALTAIARGDLQTLISEMRNDFEFVILQAPPILLTSDTAEIAPLVDGALLVVRRDVSRIPMITAARDQLQSLGTPLLGAVILGQLPTSPASEYAAVPSLRTVESRSRDAVPQRL